jgi:hypothetical protein
LPLKRGRTAGFNGAIQSELVPKATAVDDLEGRYSAWPLVNVQSLGLSDPVFETTEGNLETISPWIIGNAQQRHPFRRNLPADGERRGHGSQVVSGQGLRQIVAKGLPFRLVEFPQCHS